MVSKLPFFNLINFQDYFAAKKWNSNMARTQTEAICKYIKKTKPLISFYEF